MIYATCKNVAATTPAVSVRNRVSPRLTGYKILLNAGAISSFEKSPSGPINLYNSAIDQNSFMLFFCSNHNEQLVLFVSIAKLLFKYL